MIAGMINVFFFVIGVLVGAVVLARWWIHRTNKPEVAQALLKSLYRKAHPHWLQRSKEDDRAVCPCCGWSETEALGGHEADR